MRPARPVTLALLLAISASACIEETTVIGDERTRLACEDALVLEAPAAGCTTLLVESRGPYGCAVRDERGNWVEEHAGSWVRLHRPATQPATLAITPMSGACAPDAGPRGCALAAYLTTRGDAPCACLSTSLETHPLALGVRTELSLAELDQEVLLEPLGATFEISICSGATPVP